MSSTEEKKPLTPEQQKTIAEAAEKVAMAIADYRDVVTELKADCSTYRMDELAGQMFLVILDGKRGRIKPSRY